MDKIWY